jgi:hypothetical protein
MRTQRDARSWSGFDILVVSPTPTHPQDHGNRKRIFELCSELKRQGAKIHFVHYAAEHDWRTARPARREAEMMATWDSYQLVAPSRSLHDVAVGPDHLIDEWADPVLSSYIRWAFKVRTYDVVLVEYTWLSFCFDAVPEGVFKICDTHDVFGGRRALLEAHAIAPEFFYTTADEEKKGLRRADLVWAIKESEQSYFETSLGLKDCITMLYAEPPRGWWLKQPSQDGWLRVGIMGARNNVNRSNLAAFIATALPIFESYMAPVKLMIAGGCSDDFKDYHHPNLEVLGRVADVAEFYRDMDVICAPVQFSTGLKIKVAEALASGAPLVAHAHAMEGYPVDDPRHAVPDFGAIARELVTLAFEPSALPALAAKSAAATQKIQALVIEALEETRQRVVAAAADGIVVVAPLEALDPRGLLHDHLFATLNYLRFAARISLYLVGKAVQVDTNIVAGFGFGIRVFMAPELASAMGEAAPEHWTVLDLAAVLQTRGTARAYFLCADRQVASIWPGTLRRAFVRYDAVELAGDEPMTLIDLLRSITSVVVIAARPMWMAEEGTGSVWQVPFRRQSAFTSFRMRASMAGMWGGFLILARADDPLIGPLKELGARLGVAVAVLDVYDVAAVRALTLPSSGSGNLANVAGAHLIVELGTASAVAAVVVEGAQRAGVPVIRLVRGAPAGALQQSRHISRACTIGTLMRLVAAGLIEGNGRRRLIEAAQREAANLTRNDAGWNCLWQELTRKEPVTRDRQTAGMLFG